MSENVIEVVVANGLVITVYDIPSGVTVRVVDHDVEGIDLDTTVVCKECGGDVVITDYTE